MATTYYLTRDDELFIQEEVTYGTSPGALAGTDAFKHTSGRSNIEPVLEELPRDRDHDFQQPSVLEIQTGRKHSNVKIDAEVIPSGNAATITPPDVEPLLKTTLGSRLIGTAHTTTAAGSTGVTLNLTPGGGAASGVAIGQVLAVDVSTAVGYEARRVTNVAGDVVTVDRAFTTDPAAARTVKLGVTYKLLQSLAASAYLWLFSGTTGLRYVVPGLILPQLEVGVGFSENVIIPKFSWGGMGKFLAAQSTTSRPTPTTAGSPLSANVGYAWLGATKYCIVSAALRVNNGLELRRNESCNLEPTGVKRTANNSRYNVEQDMQLLMSTGDTDTDALFSGGLSLTARNSLIQIGNTAGSIFGWVCPNWKPRPKNAEQDGELALNLSGRALGTSGDDDVYIYFI